MIAQWRSNLALSADVVLELALIAMVLTIPYEKHTAALLSALVFCALALVAVILLARGGTARIPTPLDLPIFVLVLLSVLSTIFSTDALISLKSMRATLIMFLLVYYLIVYGVTSIERTKRLVLAFLIGSTAICFYGLYTFFSGYGMLDGRIRSTFLHPTRFANYLVFVAAISFCLALRYRPSRWGQALLYAVFGLGLVCLVLTGARGANLGLMLGFALVFGVRDKRVWATLALIVLISAAILPFQSSHLHFMKADELFSGTPSVEALLGERPSLWRSGLLMAKDHPVLGIGYGKTYNLLYGSKYALAATTQDHSSAHNILIETALETGPLGLAAFLWLNILIFKEAWRLTRGTTARNSFTHALSAGILIGIIGVTCNGMFNYFYKDRLVLLYWFFVGLTFSLRRLCRADAAR